MSSKNEREELTFSGKVLKAINPIFPKQVHPFNLQNDGKMSYAEWQFEKGEKTLEFYHKKYSDREMFEGKDVLDMGCGAGGKSIYYASLGAKSVTGIDIVEAYEKETKELAKEKGYEDKFKFVLGDATKLPFEDNTFDTIIMNDFFEHVSNPEKALQEAIRVSKKDGRIFLNFPPYNHPFGAHLSDAINMPWVHKFFKETTLISVYKDLIKDLPDYNERVNLRFSKNQEGKEYISYINKMTIKRFDDILEKLNIKPVFYELTPIRPFLGTAAKFGPFKESLNKMVTCVITKESVKSSNYLHNMDAEKSNSI